MTPRHITVDCLGRIWEVIDIWDRLDKETIDPALAKTCVVLWGMNAHPASTNDIPIYTVN